MPRLKTWLRRAVACALYYSGALWLYARLALRGKAVVLMYHRVLPAGADTFSHDGIIVTPETFALQMAFLKKHFSVLRPEQFASQLLATGFCRPAVLVTLDDGWQDNARHALPVLAETGVPATVFVATAFPGTRETLSQERLARLLYRVSRSHSANHALLAEAGVASLPGLPDAEARQRIKGLMSELRQMKPAAIATLIERLDAETRPGPDLQKPFGEDHFLDWEEIRRLASSGLVTIGSHAHTHTPLPGLGYKGAREEFKQSRQAMRRHGLPDPSVCAYPKGEVDDDVARATRDAGFTLGFATGHGRTRHGDDPFRIRRVNVHENSSSTRAEFLCLMLGVL